MCFKNGFIFIQKKKACSTINAEINDTPDTPKTDVIRL